MESASEQNNESNSDCLKSQPDKQILKGFCDSYSDLKGGKINIPTDITFCAQSIEFAVHKAIVGVVYDTLGVMVSSGFSEGSASDEHIDLLLPPGCLAIKHLDCIFEFCYNHSVTWDFGQAENSIHLWRLCDYLGCGTLLNQIRLRLSSCPSNSIVEGIQAALRWGCDSALATYLDTCFMKISAASSGTFNYWFDANSDEIVSALISSFQYYTTQSAHVPLDEGMVNRCDNILIVVALFASPRWSSLECMASLSLRDFAKIMSSIQVGDLCESARCDIGLSYLERNEIPFDAAHAQVLLGGAVSLRSLTQDYVQARLAPKMPQCFVDIFSSHVPISGKEIICPITRSLILQPCKLSCGHIVEKDARAIGALVGLKLCPFIGCRGFKHGAKVVVHGPTKVGIEAYKDTKKSALKKLQEWAGTIVDTKRDAGTTSETKEEGSPCRKRSRKDGNDCSVEQVLESARPVMFKLQDTVFGTEVASDFFYKIIPKGNVTNICVEDVTHAYAKARLGQQEVSGGFCILRIQEDGCTTEIEENFRLDPEDGARYEIRAESFSG